MLRTTIQKQISIMAALIVAIFVLAFGMSFSVKAQDKSFVYESIKVNAVLNEDSTMEVTEEITYRFSGEFHGVFREITLEDESDKEACKSNSILQCGGFEYLIVQDVLDKEGKSLKGKYREFDIEDLYQSRHRVEWEFSPGGTYFDGETFTWTIKYKVLGSLGYFKDYDLFYWNVLFEDRAEPVENFRFNLEFPEDVSFKEQNLKVFAALFDYKYTYDKNNNILSLSSANVPPYTDYTVLYQFPKGIIKEYAKLNLTLDPDKQNVAFDEFELEDVEEKLYGIPPGQKSFLFSKSGYYTQKLDLDLSPGEIQNVSITLEPTLFTRVLQALIILGNVILCLFIPGFIYFLYAWWQRKGRDRGGRKTIVPWFEPPDNIPPYLLGSLKDEKVDMLDITGTIIDLAYRGFIKIKELGEKKVTDYQLIKQKSFDSSELTATERQILNSIFQLGTGESTILQALTGGSVEETAVNLEDLKYKFYMKLNSIKDGIYNEMVERGYFDRRPDRVRGKYLGLGIAALFLGCASSFVVVVIPLYVLPFAAFVVGIGMIVISFFMPSKTPKGTEIFEQAKGFRMYLHTAERFRMQKLTPKTFEKFLSYAIIFKVEKEWASKFKDIYKTTPDWYEGRPGSTFNSLYLANAVTRFGSTTGASMVSTPRSSGSSGGGWSGGGGFGGGFSGGGGGGGGGGAW